MLKRKRGLACTLSAALTIGALGALPVAATAEDEVDHNAAKDHYVQQVVTILRTHIEAMRWIIDHENFKYDDNMVRHATAFEQTFGMVGPMGWHAAEAFKYAVGENGDGSAVDMTEAQFKLLGDQSHAAIKVMSRAARRFMRDRDTAAMNEAINGLMDSCHACHSKMPEGTVPQVWKGLRD